MFLKINLTNDFFLKKKRMEYSTAMKQTIAAYTDINKAQIQNVEHKEPSTNVCVLYNFIYTQFKSEQN